MTIAIERICKLAVANRYRCVVPTSAGKALPCGQQSYDINKDTHHTACYIAEEVITAAIKQCIDTIPAGAVITTNGSGSTVTTLIDGRHYMTIKDGEKITPK